MRSQAPRNRICLTATYCSYLDSRCACSSNRVTTDTMTLLTPAAAAAAVGTADSEADEAIL